MVPDTLLPLIKAHRTTSSSEESGYLRPNNRTRNLAKWWSTFTTTIIKWGRSSSTHQRNKKARCADWISEELWKQGGAYLPNLLDCYMNLWNNTVIGWRKALYTHYLRKEINPAVTITSYKILTKTIETRLRSYTENTIGEYQGGFRTEYSTVLINACVWGMLGRCL